MKQYKYTALNVEKKKFSGTFLAKDEKDLAEQLAKQNLYLVSATIYSGKTPSAFFTTGTGKVTLGELTTFCRQFSIMLNAGISVLDCLESLKVQPFSTYFKNILNIIYDDVKSGIALSEAINKHSKVFPDFFRNMIYVGEVSGKLSRVFSSLADYYERDSAVKRKTKSALSYPIMLGFMTIGIIVLMLAFVVPTFRGALDSMEVELSGLTKTVYAISDFLTGNWLYILAIIAVVGCTIFILAQTKSGKAFIDSMKIRLPFVKKIQIDLIASRFARAFSLMISSGMDISSALDAVTVIIGNSEVERRFKSAAEEVKHGTKLAVAFEKYKIFPRILLQMISVGERTAALDTILQSSCTYFDDQAEESLNSVTSKIQPVMLMILGVVIGLMFIAIYSPMISIMQGIV